MNESADCANRLIEEGDISALTHFYFPTLFAWEIFIVRTSILYPYPDAAYKHWSTSSLDCSPWMSLFPAIVHRKEHESLIGEIDEDEMNESKEIGINILIGSSNRLAIEITFEMATSYDFASSATLIFNLDYHAPFSSPKRW
jgi:hypothetical protein